MFCIICGEKLKASLAVVFFLMDFEAPVFLLLFFLAKKVTKKPGLVQGVFRLRDFDMRRCF